MIFNNHGDAFTKGELVLGLALIFGATFSVVVGVWALITFLVNLFQGNYHPIITTAFVISCITTLFVAWANFGTNGKG